MLVLQLLAVRIYPYTRIRIVVKARSLMCVGNKPGQVLLRNKLAFTPWRTSFRMA